MTDGSSTDVEATLRSMRALRPRLLCGEETLVELYWRFHPRYRFVKTATARASLLDIGAGTGGLAQWRHWGEPLRDDLTFYGVDTQPGEHVGTYRAWECLDLDGALPVFPGVVFDAGVLSHLIEHVREPVRLLHWIAGRMRPGGRLYIEWPGAASLLQPRREALLSHGVDIMITNFYDDASHVRPITMPELTGWLTDTGFTVQESGRIDLGLIGEEMLARGLLDGDGFKKLCGFWSVTQWAEYVVAGLARA